MKILKLLPVIVTAIVILLLVFSVKHIVNILKTIKKTGWSFKNRTAKDNSVLVFRIAVSIIMIGICIFLVFKMIHIENIGWSFQNPITSIEISDPDYIEGMACWEDMDYLNAEIFLKKALETSKDKNGMASAETAEISQKLGKLYLDMGRYNEASSLLIDAYVTFQKKFGDGNGLTIIAKAQTAISDIQLGNIEQGFAELNRLYDETKFYEYKFQIAQMIAQCESDLGNFERALLWYDVLGNAYSELDIRGLPRINLINDYACLQMYIGNYESALEALEAALNQWIALDIEDDTTVVNLYGNISIAYNSIGQSDKAVAFAEKAIATQKKLYGEGSFFEAILYNTLAQGYTACGLEEKGLEYLEIALNISLSSVGENHICTASVYSSLGDFYKYKDPVLAMEYLNKSLEIRKNILGLNSRDTAWAYESISEVNRINGDYIAALENAQYSIDICEHLYGVDNPNTAHAYITAAWAYADNGQYSEAESKARIAESIYTKQGENAVSMQAYAQQTLGYVYLKEKEYDHALSLFERALLLYKENKEVNTVNVMNTYIFIGDTYLNSGDIAACSENYRLAFNMAKEIYGNERIPEDISSRVEHLFKELKPAMSFEQWMKEWNEGL